MVDILAQIWPLALGVITQIIVLAKMHGDIETLKEKVRVLFELWNKKGE